MTRQNGSSAAILDKEEYDAIMETMHLLRSPANAQRLMHSIEAAEAGELVERSAFPVNIGRQRGLYYRRKLLRR